MIPSHKYENKEIYDFFYLLQFSQDIIDIHLFIFMSYFNLIQK